MNPHTNGREWVIQRVHSFGDRAALVYGDDSYSFRALAECVEHWVTKLDASTIQGKIVIVNGDFTPNTIGAILALYMHAAVIVPLHAASAAVVADVSSIVSADLLLDTLTDTALVELATRRESHPLVLRLRQSGDAGLILLSSGSTGAPKAMLLNMDRLIERFQQPREGAAKVTAAFLLFDHIGGFNTLMHCLFSGGTLVRLESRNPHDVCARIARHGIQLLPTTPTFLNMLLISRAYEKFTTDSLEMLTYGTEVMPEKTLRDVNAVFPDVRLKQTYGLSEIGILPTQSRSNDSLWMKIGNNDIGVKVVDNILWLKSRSAMLGYLNAASPIDVDGWLCTGDLVEVDGDYYKILGRAQTLINVGGLKVHPAEVESHILDLGFVRDVAVWGKRSAVTGQIVAASVILNDAIPEADAKAALIEHCRGSLDSYKVPRFVEFVTEQLHNERFKKTRPQAAHNGKRA